MGSVSEMKEDFIAGIIGQFAVRGEFVSYRGFGTGHINSTYVSTFDQSGKQVRYTHQKINRNVFVHPDEVMENIVAVTEHVRAKLEAEGAADPERGVLTVVPTVDGKSYFLDRNGDYWRTYLFIDGARSFEVLESPEMAFRVGEAIGFFQLRLSDYAGPRLHETIPRFHDMRWRYEKLDEALASDVKGRSRLAAPEIDFLLDNRDRGMRLIDGLRSGALREGITHNDTKLNNVLFDETNGKAVCVIDLDTVMPGTILFDTGDLIRTATITGEEDERDLSKIGFDIGMFKSLIRGYLSKAGHFLSPLEKEMLAESGRNITQIMAVRFLTDYLNGDVYYKIARPDHNIDRTRTQIALIKSMDVQWDEVVEFIAGLANK